LVPTSGREQEKCSDSLRADTWQHFQQKHTSGRARPQEDGHLPRLSAEQSAGCDVVTTRLFLLISFNEARSMMIPLLEASTKFQRALLRAREVSLRMSLIIDNDQQPHSRLPVIVCELVTTFIREIKESHGAYI